MAATALVLPPQPVAIVQQGGLVSLPWRSALQNALNNLQAQITALAALEGDTTALETALAALQAEVDAAESSIAAHIADTANPHATTAAQVGADPAGTATAAVAAHEAALDPHPQYLTEAEGDAAYDALGDAAAALVSANAYTDDEIAALNATSGTWTPTITNSTNVTSSTPRQGQWSRVGNTITFSVRIEVAATVGTSTATVIGVSLPVASALTTSFQAIGAGTVAEVPYVPALVVADATNDRLTVGWYATSTTGRAVHICGSYEVL